MRTKGLRLKTLGCWGAFLILAACENGGGKKVYFGNLENGSNVESPFQVQMKAENLIVEPASMGVNQGHGHFHILVDEPLSSPSAPIPKDAKHIHYGNGQTETTLDLAVGQHTLVLEFAKGDHVPYDPPIYQQIVVNVTKRNLADTASAAKADTSGKAAASAGADTSAKAKAGSAAGAADTKKPKQP